MLQKWKCILTNWINCYFKENSKKEQNVSLESILSIISHLRENLNLDESTSSTLKAHTVEEFIVEKYSNFKFENGSVEPSSEEEIYIVASLLLFFVCVNSKDVDIKNAMCSKLSYADQEVIMKFSKCLMECTPISYTDVKTAIAEACGQESASVDDGRKTITETPPALRSLHSEVRRLQAALDAERFDKNYLQEELARTNLKLEKLLKDKEQYKLDIVNLKAKISLCCGQEAEANGAKNGGEGSAKLLRQLEQMEEKLVETQGQLDDMQYERDSYKAKIDELKQERDKWLTFSQQENSRVSQLTEELEVERRHVQSLRDLVTELRQHNQLNRLDTSQLECDDPDTSIHSVQNLSVCSEVCANVVEVQLGEERAKIDVLKQQIQTMQDQLNDISKKGEDEKKILEKVIMEKDNELLNLKHHINEEIEENNNLKAHFSDEISKLNNEINELEQKLQDNTQQSRQIIEAKMQDIQILQEEKLSLLQSLSNEITKLNKIIKGLKSELDVEKNAKLCMREEYENHIMKLNEKVLNRNNELVELQNKISESSEQLEDLQSQLRKERKTNEEIIEKYNLDLDQLTKEKIQIANMLQLKDSEIGDLKSQLTQHIAHTEELKKNVEINQDIIQKYSLEIQHLENQKQETANALHEKIIQIEELQNQQTQNIAYTERLNKEIDDLKSTNQEIIEKYSSELEILKKENLETTTTLQKKDMEIKELQNQVTQHITYTGELTSNIDDLKESLKEEKLRGAMISEQNALKIEELQNQLSQNIAFIDKLNNNIDQLTITKQEIIEKYTLDVKQMNEEKKQVTEMLRDKLQEIEELHNQLTQNIVYTDELKKNIFDLSNVNKTSQDIIKACSMELEQLKVEKIEAVNMLEKKVFELKESQNQLSLSKTDISQLNKNIDDLKMTNESIINRYNMLLEKFKDEKLQAANLLEQKVLEMGESQEQNNANIEKLNKEIDYLKQNNQNIFENYNLSLKKLQEENAQMANILEEKVSEIKELQIQIRQNNAHTEELNRNINDLKKTKQYAIEKLCVELDQLKEEKVQTSNILEQRILQIDELQNLLTQSNANTEELQKNIDRIKTSNRDIIAKQKMELEQLNNEKVQAANILERNVLKIESLENLLTSKNTNIDELNYIIEELKASKQEIIEKYSLESKLLKENNMQLESTLKEKVLQIIEFQNQSVKNNVYIDDLNNKIKELNATNLDVVVKYNLELEQIKEEETQTSNILKQKCLEVEELQNLLTQNNVMNEELNNEIKELKAIKQSVTEKYNFELAQLNEEKAQVSVMLRQKDLKIEELQNLLTENNISSEVLNNNIEELKATKQGIIEKYSSELQLLKQEKAQTENIIKQNVSEKGELQNQLSRNNMYINELTNNITKLHATKQEIIEKFNLKLELLKEDKVQMSETLKEKSLEIRELQSQLTENKECTEKLNKTIEDLKAKNDDMGSELIQLKEEKVKAVKILEQKVLEIKELTRNIDDLNARNQDIIEKYSLKLKELKEEKVQTMIILQQKDFEIKELHNQLTQNNANIENLNNNIDVLKMTNEDIIKQYSLNLKQLEEEKVKVENIVTQKVSEIEKLQNQLKIKIANIEELNKNINDLKEYNEEIVVKYNLELEQLKEKNVQANDIVEQKTLELREVEKQLIQNKAYIEELNLNMTTANQDVIEKYTLELEELKKEHVDKLNLLQQKVLETKDLQKELTQNKEYAEELHGKVEQLKGELQEKIRENIEIGSNNKKMSETINELVKEKSDLEQRRMEYTAKIAEMDENILVNDAKDNEKSSQLKKDNAHLIQIIEENRTVITNLEQLIKHELQQNQQLREDNGKETINLTNKCFLLQEYQTKAEKELDEREKEITILKKEVQLLKNELENYERNLREKDEMLSAVIQEKDAVIGTISKELVEEKEVRERCQKELEARLVVTKELRHKLENVDQQKEELSVLRKENEELLRAASQREIFAVNQEKASQKNSGPSEKDMYALHYQVDNTSDLTHSSMDSIKTISDLEKIIHDKNRTITTLQSDITYLKSLMADSENKLLDVTKELEVSKENCQQLSTQLKKIVHQKNEEIADLKKQLFKMSATENRATEIIKVSAKYQAIILKRIAEIKNNTVLKELTNFGNSANGDNELRRSLNAGTITMEDLENFLETTDRHLKRCSEKQQALQKERDRLTEVNRINESEIINLKKFLTELSVSFKTFSNIKDLYMQKFSKVVSVQRTVRREILNLDGHITDATMCKLERGYAAVMQDLSECTMNMERWVERCIGRTISAEKIKHAFSSDNERVSLAPTTFQNTSLEIQLQELENSFQKLLEEVMRAQKGEGAKDAQSITVMEVRAEYEDKLNRMKAKMKQLYHEQIAVFQKKQKEEIAVLERELQLARDKLAESSRAYDKHIRELTTELWSMGEKFLMKKDEAEWLRRKQRSGSLMSLQHVHSSGLVARPEEVPRPSDTHSLRSLPVHNNNNTNIKREGRGLHMSDEEGEVFDNRCLKELSSTPRRTGSPPNEGQRLSELRWRNSLCPPHLKSSYPAETQFGQAIDEDDIKCFGASGKQQRKEVGITAYKKPGPPTPSKQAGRLSATDSELRESLRVEADPQPSRKTSTPSRLRALFRSAKNDTADGTPRTKRLSLFRKK